jgi:hypothetical protein
VKGKAHSVEQKNKAGGGEREREWCGGGSCSDMWL